MNLRTASSNGQQQGRGEDHGFTLIELLVVIAIIGILAMLIFPSFTQARARARQSTCANNLRQFSLAVSMYREDHDELPDWLSDLRGQYVQSDELFLCPSDRSRGADGSKPNMPQAGAQYPSADDPNKPCSYFYEFNGNICEWYSSGFLNEDLPEGTPATWKNVKLQQLRHGDSFRDGPWPESSFPMIRCFHHVLERQVTARDPDTANIVTSGITINVAYAGNIFIAPSQQWEFEMLDQ